MNEYVYGKNVINEIVKVNKRKIQKLYLVKPNKEYAEYESITQYVSSEELEKITKTKKNQNICAQVANFEYTQINLKNANRVLILDHIEDPQNLGAILRSAECFGFKNIVIPKDRSAKITPLVQKISSGASEYLNIQIVTNINQYIKELKKENFWVIGSTLQTTNNLDILEKFKENKVCMIVGNEGKGMHELTQKNCDLLVKIPMNGMLNSLNVVNATAILMYSIQGVKND